MCDTLDADMAVQILSAKDITAAPPLNNSSKFQAPYGLTHMHSVCDGAPVACSCTQRFVEAQLSAASGALAARECAHIFELLLVDVAGPSMAAVQDDCTALQAELGVRRMHHWAHASLGVGSTHPRRRGAGPTSSEDEESVAEFADAAAVARLLETEGGMGQLLRAGSRGIELAQCMLAIGRLHVMAQTAFNEWGAGVSAGGGSRDASLTDSSCGVCSPW